MCQKVETSTTFFSTPAEAKVYKTIVKDSTGLDKALYDGKVKPWGLHSPTVHTTFADLFKGYTDQIGYSFKNLKPGDPRWTHLAGMELNLFAFSALKNFTFLNAASEFRGLPFKDFQQAYDTLHQVTYKNYMRAEREHVIRVAEAREEWEEVLDFKNTHQILRYHTAGDDRVRLEHKSWDKITLPVEHSFWKTHFPPNGYNCRCWTSQDFENMDGDRTPSLENLSRPDPGFRTNFGATDYSFGQGHNYFKVDFAAQTQLNSNIASMFKRHLNGFIAITDLVKAHPTMAKAEITNNVQAAIKLVGHIDEPIHLNPTLNTATGFKNADFYIQDKPADFKRVKQMKYSTLRATIAEASKQNIDILILQSQDLSIRDLARLNGQPHRYKVQQIWIQDGSDLIKYIKGGDQKWSKK